MVRYLLLPAGAGHAPHLCLASLLLLAPMTMLLLLLPVVTQPLL
jgi:hypothetical protein